MTNADEHFRHICRYPVHLIDVLWLADGTRVTIRPTLPQDIELQRAFFHALSPSSRYNRFMTHLSELPPALAERFANIDFHHHLALLASVFDAEGRETMIAEARYALDDRDPCRCELAIAVADDWQRCGIASALMSMLERQALSAGVVKIGAETLANNCAMRALAASRGFSVMPCPEDVRMVRLEKTLPAQTCASSARSMAA